MIYTIYSLLLSLLVQLTTNSEVCYNEIGCFTTNYPWFSTLRPLPLPQPPDKINVRIYLSTRQSTNGEYEIINLRPKINILYDSNFDASRPYNVFIIHGFTHSTNQSWMNDMKSAYLRERDANLFLVDWSNSAITLNYLQAASDIRVVGAELARFLQELIYNYGIDPYSIHLIGHSLGAHAAGYCGKILLGKIGRITGLDPAQPAFENCDSEVRLIESDALFVDVLHTDAKPFIVGGFGIMSPCGHVDIYANNAIFQPGCLLNPKNIKFNLKTGFYIKQTPFGSMSDVLSCSHLRAYEYFIEALNNDRCVFWAKKVFASKSKIIGLFSVILSMKKFSINECSFDTCTIFGLNTEAYPGRGVFVMETNNEKPFCPLQSECTN